MSHDVDLEPAQSKSNDATVVAIANDTETSLDVVKALYAEECAALSEKARVKTFVGVIATRNVKRYLRKLSSGTPAVNMF